MSKGAAQKVLHLLAGFDPGPESARAVAAINALGSKVGHAIVVQDRAARGAASEVAKGIDLSWPKFPSLDGKPWPGRLKGLAAAMAGYDLICTYGWGAVDAAMAHTLFADVYTLAPLVHHEFAPDPEELATGGSFARKAYRKIAFGRSAAIITGSPAIERLALEVWQQPRTRVQLIGEGVETRAFAATPPRDVLPSFIKRKGEAWIGTLADGVDGAGLAALVQALGELPSEWQGVVLGEVAPDLREEALTQAEELEVDHRLHFTGPTETSAVLGLADILLLSQPPAEPMQAVAGAMAAGLPLVLPREGSAWEEIGAMPASDNGPFLAATDDALVDPLLALAGDAATRKRVGKANRDKAREQFDSVKLLGRQLALYRSLLGGSPATSAMDRP